MKENRRRARTAFCHGGMGDIIVRCIFLLGTVAASPAGRNFEKFWQEGWLGGVGKIGVTARHEIVTLN